MNNVSGKHIIEYSTHHSDMYANSHFGFFMILYKDAIHDRHLHLRNSTKYRPNAKNALKKFSCSIHKPAFLDMIFFYVFLLCNLGSKSRQAGTGLCQAQVKL